MKILITGGTGSLGKALAERLLKQDSENEIHIFSRDENKQKAMSLKYPEFHYHVGDICSAEDLFRLSERYEYQNVYHCAASKHIEVCEKNVQKCVDINYNGVRNVYEHFCQNDKSYFCFFTTDKAVKPINAYGHAKALAEKYLIEQNEFRTNVAMFRWGNILGSTGSFLPVIVKQLKDSGVVKITDVSMSRFWLRLDDAVNYVFEMAKSPMSTYRPMIPSMKAARLLDLVQATAEEMGIKDYFTESIGIRPGEKIHEDITYLASSNTCEQYTIDELRTLIRPIVRLLT